MMNLFLRGKCYGLVDWQVMYFNCKKTLLLWYIMVLCRMLFIIYQPFATTTGLLPNGFLVFYGPSFLQLSGWHIVQVVFFYCARERIMSIQVNF